MENKAVDHYEEVCESWRRRSLGWDWKKRFEELGFAGYGPGPLPVVYFGREYRWDPVTGRLLDPEAPQRELTFAAQMNIYNLIYKAGKTPVLSGKWVPLREVRRAYPFAPAFQAGTLIPFAAYFNGRLSDLRRAGEALGFRRISVSEAGFEAQAFPGLPIRCLFWDGDEEFGAQANILFDSNITDFIHEECVVMLGQDMTRMLMEAAK